MSPTETLSNLTTIHEKVKQGKRLSAEEGLQLLTSHDLLSLGGMADQVRQRLHGDLAYFIVNTHLNYTNVCALGCKLCAFGVPRNDETAYTLPLEEIRTQIVKKVTPEITELHIVGGVNPALPLSYYESMIQIAREYRPDLHIQAFTAVEIDYLARIHQVEVGELLKRLQYAGLGSILGGGAEIFAPEIRRIIAGHKTDAKRWFFIHRTAHKLGIRSNASILYGHIEQPKHVVDHLLQIRSLQDETGGFDAFFGFAFHPDHTRLAQEYPSIPEATSGVYDLKILATARLLLDNVPHIRSFWIMIGKKLAQISLHFGVDDLDGTVVEEQIVRAAGAKGQQMLPPASFLRMIREAGRTPVERDTMYRILRRYNRETTTDAEPTKG